VNRFDAQKLLEDKYVMFLLKHYPETYTQNLDGLMPDLNVNLHGSYPLLQYYPDSIKWEEIKMVPKSQRNYNYILACHAYANRVEIEELSTNGMADHTIFKWVCCPDKKIVLIKANDIINILKKGKGFYFRNREKNHKRLFTKMRAIPCKALDRRASRMACYMLDKKHIKEHLRIVCDVGAWTVYKYI